MRKIGWSGMPVEAINWKDADAKDLLDKTLKEMLDNPKLTINISNIVSQEFIDLYNVNEPEDFNGWQCDWWSHMYYEGVKINVGGGAFYGTINLYIENEDED